MRIIQITDTITTLKEKYLRTIREQKRRGQGLKLFIRQLFAPKNQPVEIKEPRIACLKLGS